MFSTKIYATLVMQKRKMKLTKLIQLKNNKVSWILNEEDWNGNTRMERTDIGIWGWRGLTLEYENGENDIGIREWRERHWNMRMERTTLEYEDGENDIGIREWRERHWNTRMERTTLEYENGENDIGIRINGEWRKKFQKNKNNLEEKCNSNNQS